MEALTYYPGSIGEIIQGNSKGIDILMSCPINLFTKVRVFESNSVKRGFNVKSTMLLKNLLEKWNLQEYINKLDIEIKSNIPKGKGFASSTADLCGTYHSLIKLFNREYDEDELMRECIKIEPTDSIIFDKMTIFDYKNGSFKECVGDYLKFYLLVFEGQNIVNTIEFNKKVSVPLSTIDDIIADLKDGVRQKDIKKIAEVSTESIIRNQNRLKYDILWDIIRMKDTTGGLGIVGAHSGDLMAVIYDDLEKAERALNKTKILRGYKTYILKSVKLNEMC
ncbi:GHMP family kinase ATP-binding protein [Clostridium sp. ZS2-4]|uniref:GHMP family kinase ATP-binding protein n=1 Tax=Clostridium sp. ZS2-4 TaxID=2987703 RepID=UPI00227B0CF4|nr:kinase [Clostridium sp. ZS2-4]MCY6356328.1 kinase [Clostridium sp. ZS2-4]